MPHATMLFLLFLLGLIAGSFFNVVIYRLFTLLPIRARSRCTDCQRALPFFDVIPLFSYWQLGGACRYCKKPIHIYYPLTEFFTGVVFAFIGWNPLSLFIASVLIIVIVSDARYRLIFDWVIVPCTFILVIAKLFAGASIVQMFLGALIGLIFFGLQYYFSDGKWIGFGDVKLAVFLGLAFGFVPMLYIIPMAYVIGSLVSVVLLVLRKMKMTSALPLGTFLGFAALAILIFGTRPIERLLHL